MTQNDTENGLSPKQARAIEALMEHRTAQEAARAAQISTKTLYRWLSETPFKRAILEAENDLITNTTRRLLALSNGAVDALESLLIDPAQAGAANRRMAAASILDYLLKLRELRNMEARLAELEAAVYGNMEERRQNGQAN